MCVACRDCVLAAPNRYLLRWCTICVSLVAAYGVLVQTAPYIEVNVILSQPALSLHVVYTLRVRRVHALNICVRVSLMATGLGTGQHLPQQPLPKQLQRGSRQYSQVVVQAVQAVQALGLGRATASTMVTLSSFPTHAAQQADNRAHQHVWGVVRCVAQPLQLLLLLMPTHSAQMLLNSTHSALLLILQSCGLG